VAVVAHARVLPTHNLRDKFNFLSGGQLLIRLRTDVEAADRRKNGGSFALPVKIDDDVWIGMKANIMPGSKLEIHLSLVSNGWVSLEDHALHITIDSTQQPRHVWFLWLTSTSHNWTWKYSCSWRDSVRRCRAIVLGGWSSSANHTQARTRRTRPQTG